MIEKYSEALEEFKRVDHLYHVSLKYTRTVDVLRSVIERIIATYENAIQALLRCMKEEKEIDEIPANPVSSALLVQERYSSEPIVGSIDMYLRLRKLMRAPYTKREEYRRHVTMIIDFEGEEFNVDIDLLKEYYDITAEFLTHIKKRVEPYRDV